MKPMFSLAGTLALVLFIAALTGCATGQDARHRQHHPGVADGQTAGPMSSGSGSDNNQMGMMDMKAMCDMHQEMMRARTPEERRAMMPEHMKGMSPEMMQKQMDMMQEKCK